MPTVTFTVTGRLLDFGDDPVVGTRVTATASPSIKVGDVAVHSNQPDTTVTDADGNFSLELVSLPGLWYRITAGRAINPVRIAAYIPDVSDPTTGAAFAPSTTFDIHDLVDETPTPGYQGLYLDAIGGVTDHGALTGLADDDHPQYLTVARGDARYFTEAETNAAIDAYVAVETTARQAADAALDGRLDLIEDPTYRDGRYYTKTQTDAEFATKADLTDLDAYTSLTALADEEAARIAGDNALDGRVDTLEAATSGYATDSELAAHAADTTAIHGIADTANLVLTSDARLSDARTPTTHTHTASQVTDFMEAAQDAIAALLVGASGVSLSYNDGANTLTITGGGSGGLDAEAVRDAIGVALIGTGLITVTVNDALDTITISTTATANSSDAYLLARGNHTGTDDIADVAGLQAALDDLDSDKAPVIHIHNSVDITDLFESIDDRVNALLAAGAGISLSYNDAGNVLTIASTITQYTDEMARDALGTALVAGTNVTITPNDVGDTITIAASGGTSYTDENARDAIGAALVAGTGVAISVNDGADTITISDGAQTINAQTGTTYTAVAGDAGKIVTLSNAAAIALSIPGSAFTAGQRIDFIVLGAGMVTVAGSAGATVVGTPSLVSRAQYSAFSVIALSATSFVVVGDMA